MRLLDKMMGRNSGAEKTKDPEQKSGVVCLAPGDPVPPTPCFLKPSKGYLWDTEQIIEGKRGLSFFDRPLNQPMMWRAQAKTDSDTNMVMAGLLVPPEKFYLAGVHLSTSFLEKSQREELLFDGRVRFLIGEREYFDCMLSDLDSSQKSKSQWTEAVKRFAEAEAGETRNEDDPVKCHGDELSPFFQKEPLFVGKYAIELGSGEDAKDKRFRWVISWSKPVKVDVLVRIAMYGLRFQPIRKGDA